MYRRQYCHTTHEITHTYYRKKNLELKIMKQQKQTKKQSFSTMYTWGQKTHQKVKIDNNDISS